jgi:hypothetical protein
VHVCLRLKDDQWRCAFVRTVLVNVRLHAGKQVGDDSPPIFGKGVAAAVACATSARLQVFHALFRPIRSTLSNLSKLEVWGAAPAESAGSSGFSSPPSEYIHGIAQSLLDVPTMVQEGSLSTAAASELWEVLASGALEASAGKMKLTSVRMAGLVQAIDADNEEDEQPEDDEQDAAYNWLVLVAKGTVAMILAQVELIPRLTEKGCAQLAADLAHWTKVLGAGEMEPGPVLLQVCSMRVYRLAQMARGVVGALLCADRSVALRGLLSPFVSVSYVLLSCWDIRR